MENEDCFLNDLFFNNFISAFKFPFTTTIKAKPKQLTHSDKFKQIMILLFCWVWVVTSSSNIKDTQWAIKIIENFK